VPPPLFHLTSINGLGLRIRISSIQESVLLTLPPVLLARQETTTSTGEEKAVLVRDSMSDTLPNRTSAPSNSCRDATH